MQASPFRRALATLLCCQPVFWMSDIALAQTFEPGGSLATRPSLPGLEEQAVAPGAQGLGVPSAFSQSAEDGAQLGARIPQPTPIDVPVDANAYVCGPGDVIDLNFWGLASFRLRTTVDVEGRAFVPKAGYFSLKGKTLTEARRIMRESVARYYPSLGFDITLARPRTFLVQVVGGVAHPGSYAARATDRVAALIALAGGYAPNGSERRIEIRHLDGSIARADLLLYALDGDIRNNPYLLDGDVLQVQFREFTASIAGAVNRPGRYELVDKRDLAELVTVAGGLTPEATRQLPISIVRRLADDRREQRLVEFREDSELPWVALKQEDAVRVSSYSELQQSVTVVGAIAGVDSAATPVAGTTGPAASVPEAGATRRTAFVEGDTVRTLLARVGGVGELADLKRSYILRRGSSIPVDLEALVLLRDLSADRAIELGDTLVIPLRRRDILVEGAVFAPGVYPYNPAFRVEQYLALAGGRNRFAQPLSDVRVVTPDGEMKKYRSDLNIEPGASLVVPERSFSRSEVVQIVLGVAGVVVSGVAVVIAARK